MPYIDQSIRQRLEPFLRNISRIIVEESEINGKGSYAGNLNYVVTKILLKSIKLRFGEFRYHINPLVRGVLLDVADEFYRRITTPYEKKKCKENGDVYDWD